MSFIQWLDRWRQRPTSMPLAQEELLEDVLQWVLTNVEPRLRFEDRRVRVRTVLLAVAPFFLVEIDQRMRSYRRPRADDLPDDMLDRLARPDVDPATREAGQFLISMHWSGYLRERAVRELEASGSRLALAASLIRSADWVDPVRVAATKIAERLIDRCAEEDVFALMSLVLRLERHARFDRTRLRGKLDTWLTRSDERVRRALEQPHAPLRRWALGILLARPLAVDQGMLRTAVNDPDPTVSLLAFESLDALPDALHRDVMATGLTARHPAVRQRALRALARHTQPVPVDVLQRALIDRSAGMRSFAAHTFRLQYPGDPADVWRALVDKDAAPSWVALSLAESASPDDEGRLHRLLAHRDGRARAAALRSLANRGMTVTDEAFIRFAGDPSRLVVRVLAELCRKGDAPLDHRRMQLVWTSLPDQAASILDSLLAALPSGESEDLLLAFEPLTEASRQWWNARLIAWSGQALGWWEPSKRLRERLTDLLSRQSAALESSLRKDFQKTVAR